MQNIPFIPSPNFHVGGMAVDLCVIHTMAGHYQGTIAWFQNPKSQVSAHYLISKLGQITQMTKETDRAWHICNANFRGIGLELEDYSPDGSKGAVAAPGVALDPNWYTAIQLETAAELAADIMTRHKIPISGLIGHNDPILKPYGNTHFDPGPAFPWNKFRGMVAIKLGIVSTIVGSASA